MRKSTVSGLLVLGVAWSGALCAAPANAAGLPVVSGADALTSQQKAGVQGLGCKDKKSSKSNKCAKSTKSKKSSKSCTPAPPPCRPTPPRCS